MSISHLESQQVYNILPDLQYGTREIKPSRLAILAPCHLCTTVVDCTLYTLHCTLRDNFPQVDIEGVSLVAGLDNLQCVTVIRVVHNEGTAHFSRTGRRSFFTMVRFNGANWPATGICVQVELVLDENAGGGGVGAGAQVEQAARG
jgi:hypothetical protein